MAALLTWSASASAGLSRNTEYWPLFDYFGRAYLKEYDPAYLAAQAWTESRWNPVAVSPVGATGLMQIMPGTGAEIASIRGMPQGPLTNPVISILYGSVYMRRCVDFWTTPRPDPVDTLELAWASYNAGVGNVLKAQGKAGGALLWRDIAPHLHEVTGRHAKETIDYVDRNHRYAQELMP